MNNGGRILIWGTVLSMLWLPVWGRNALAQLSQGPRWIVCYPPPPEELEVVRPVPPVVVPGGTGLPVFDAANTAVNTITATRAGEQVRNQERQIALAKQNLVHAGHCVEDTGRLLMLLDEVLPFGTAMHYQLRTPGTALAERYPGFSQPPGYWWVAYNAWAQGALDTLSGTLETVHYQLRPERQEQEAELLNELVHKSSHAAGNLDATQAGNMLMVQGIEEQRKLRQLLGATMNAQNVTQAHVLAVQAAQERIEHDWLERSLTPIPVYNGQAGYGMFGATR